MTTAPGTLVCPKCQGRMRTYERSGIHIDQCQECRGVFLDRGELDRLIDEESSYLERAERGGAPPPEQPPFAPSWGGGHYGGGHPHGGHPHGGHHHRRRKGLLSELFD